MEKGLRIKELRKENRGLKRANRQLKEENKSLKEMIDYLRKNIYGKSKKKKRDEYAARIEPKKKGAPFGHKGVTRPKPENIDEEIEVSDPRRCPDCGSEQIQATSIKEEHIQEEIVIPRRKVVRYVKSVYTCKKCKTFIRGVGKGEMPGSYIGPLAKSTANYLRYDIGISQHKLQRIFKELFDLPFHQTSVVGFETQLRVRSQSLYEDMQNILKKTKLLYIDETGWKKDGFPYWLWCFCNRLIAFYHIEDSRGGKVLKAILGDTFKGIIISDFLSAYNAIESKKQKCLPHALRIIKRLEDASHGDDKEVDKFCRQLKEIIQEIITLFKKRKNISDYVIHRGDIIARCNRLLSHELSHKKAERLRLRLNKRREELYTCLFHPSSDSNNNFVERMLRPNVIMRKLTYGNRSQKGIKNHSVITSLLQTSKLNNHYTPDVFQQMLTNPSQFTLKNLIRAP
jgi:predicted RNA-binding Zn-ribbon protein involved in translation (DUF1610 family)